MKRGISRSFTLVAAGVVALGISVPASAKNISENNSLDGVAVNEVTASVEAVLDYWTPERTSTSPRSTCPPCGNRCGTSRVVRHVPCRA